MKLLKCTYFVNTTGLSFERAKKHLEEFRDIVLKDQLDLHQHQVLRENIFIATKNSDSYVHQTMYDLG